MCVDRSLLCLDRSLLCVDRSLLCVNRFHVRYKSLFCVTWFIHKRPFHSQKTLPSAVPIRIPNRNRNRNRVCTSHTQCVTFVKVKKCHDFECVTSVTLSDFFKVFLAKQIWSHFGHKCHKWSQKSKCDWYKSVSISVLIETVRNEGNTAKYTRK